MKLNFLKSVLVGIVLSVSSLANAGLITSGTLSRDTSSDVIVDSSGYEWLAWDYNTSGTLFDLLNVRLAANGDLYGWQVATTNEFFHMLSNAGFTGITSVCSDNNTVTYCHYTDDTLANLNHTDFFKLFKLGANGNLAEILWDSQRGTHSKRDLNWDNLYVLENSITSYIEVHGTGEWYDRTDRNTTYRMPVALYRAAQVPEPSTLAIFALGMIGLVSRRLKK
jgi:hypothetical protein